MPQVRAQPSAWRARARRDDRLGGGSNSRHEVAVPAASLPRRRATFSVSLVHRSESSHVSVSCPNALCAEEVAPYSIAHELLALNGVCLVAMIPKVRVRSCAHARIVSDLVLFVRTCACRVEVLAAKWKRRSLSSTTNCDHEPGVVYSSTARYESCAPVMRACTPPSCPAHLGIRLNAPCSEQVWTAY